MGRILKAVLIHIVIAMLIALVLPSSQSPPGPSSSKQIVISSDCAPREPGEWDYRHNLIRPTYPAQDLQGNYLPLPRDQRTSGEDKVGEELKKLVQSASDGGPRYR